MTFLPPTTGDYVAPGTARAREIRERDRREEDYREELWASGQDAAMRAAMSDALTESEELALLRAWASDRWSIVIEVTSSGDNETRIWTARPRERMVEAEELRATCAAFLAWEIIKAECQRKRM